MADRHTDWHRPVAALGRIPGFLTRLRRDQPRDDTLDRHAVGRRGDPRDVWTRDVDPDSGLPRRVQANPGPDDSGTAEELLSETFLCADRAADVVTVRRYRGHGQADEYERNEQCGNRSPRTACYA
jgi:hypothetical protein